MFAMNIYVSVPPLLCSCRLHVSIMSCLALTVIILLRVNLNLTIVCMVSGTSDEDDTRLNESTNITGNVSDLLNSTAVTFTVGQHAFDFVGSKHTFLTWAETINHK